MDFRDILNRFSELNGNDTEEKKPTAKRKKIIETKPSFKKTLKESSGETLEEGCGCNHDECDCPADCPKCDCNKHDDIDESLNEEVIAKDKYGNIIFTNRKSINEANYKVEITDLNSGDAETLSQILALAGQAEQQGVDGIGGPYSEYDPTDVDPMGMTGVDMNDPTTGDMGVPGELGAEPDMDMDTGMEPDMDMDMDSVGGPEMEIEPMDTDSISPEAELDADDSAAVLGDDDDLEEMFRESMEFDLDEDEDQDEDEFEVVEETDEEELEEDDGYDDIMYLSGQKKNNPYEKVREDDITKVDPDDVDWTAVRRALRDAAQDIFGDVDHEKLQGILTNTKKHKPNDTDNAIQTAVDMLRDSDGMVDEAEDEDEEDLLDIPDFLKRDKKDDTAGPYADEESVKEDEVEEDCGGVMISLNDILKLADVQQKPQADITVEEEEEELWDNQADEDYYDTNHMTKTLSGGPNDMKKMYKKDYPGDNHMAVESRMKDLTQKFKNFK